MHNLARLLACASLLILQSTFAIDAFVRGISHSFVDGQVNSAPTDSLRDTSQTVGNSRASARYSLEHTTNRFTFGFYHSLHLAPDGLASSTDTHFIFDLYEPATYRILTSNSWFWAQTETAYEDAILWQHPTNSHATSNSIQIYMESDTFHGLASGAFHLNGIGEGTPQNVNLGRNSGLLMPGRYFIDSSIGLRNQPQTQSVDADMLGFFYFSLEPADPSPKTTALRESIEFPVTSTTGDHLWLATDTTTIDTVDAARSGPITQLQSSSLKTSVPGPGILKFWWKVSSQQNSDFLTLVIDGREAARISGEAGWEQRQIFIPPNPHDIEWIYSKDIDGSSGQDTAWLDLVSFEPSLEPSPNVPQTVQISAPNSSQIFDEPVRIVANATSHLPVNLHVGGGSAIFQGDILVPFAPGDVWIQASQPGDAIFLPAPPLDYTVRFSAGVKPEFMAANLPQMTVPVGGPSQRIVEALALQPDGKVIIGGYFDFVHGQRRHNLARFNPDGTLDQSWAPRVNKRGVFSMVVRGNYLYIAGDFTAVNDITRVSLAKISLIDGSVEEHWNPAPNGIVWTIVPAEDKLLVGGTFSTISQTDISYLAKVSPEGIGAADSTWRPRPNDSVLGIAVQGANVYFSGPFRSVQDVSRGSIAKVSLHGTGGVDPNWSTGSEVVNTRALAATESHVFAGGYTRGDGTVFLGVAGFSAENGQLSMSTNLDKLAYKLVVHGDSLYAATWLHGKPIEKLSLSNLSRDPNWDLRALAGEPGGQVPRVLDILFRGEDLLAAGDFLSLGGSPGSGVALIPQLEGAPTISAPSTTKNTLSAPEIRITPHALDVLETTHYLIFDVQNGTLFKPAPGPLGTHVPIANGELITLAEATSGLRFLPSQDFVGTGTFKVRASKTPLPNGAGGVPAVGTIEVRAEKLPQLVTYTPIPNTPFHVGSVELKFTSTSGQPVEFSVTGPAHIVSDNILRFHGVGEVTVVAQAPGNENFTPSPRVGTIFNILKGSQAIGFEPVLDARVNNSTQLRAQSSAGLPVSFELVSGTGTLIGDVLTFNGAGTVLVRAVQSGNEFYQAAPPVEQTIVVRGRSQTITFPAALPLPYNSAPLPLVATASSGLPVSLRLVSGPATLNANILRPTGAGTVVIEAIQAGNDDFEAATAQQTFVFTRASQTIVFDPIPMLTVTSAPVQLRATASSGLPVSFSVDSDVATITNGVLRINRPGRVTVTAQQLGNENFEPSFAHGQVLDIPKIPQSITLGPIPALSLNQPVVNLSASSSSGLPVHIQASGAGSVLSNRLTLTAAGLVTIFANQPGDDMYLPADTVSVSLNVGRGDQTIRFEPVTNLIAGLRVPLNALASSGLPVNFEVISGNATLSNNWLTATAAGTIVVAARQAGNTNYFPALEVRQSIEARKLPQFLTFQPPGDTPYGATGVTLRATSSSGRPVRFEILSGPAELFGGSILLFRGTGLVSARAYEAGDVTYMPVDQEFSFTILKQAQTIAFSQPSDQRISDAPIILTAAASSGLPVEFVVVSGRASITNNNVVLAEGAGSVVIEARQTGNEIFGAAAPVRRTVNFLKGVQSISFPPLPSVRFKSSPVALTATASSGLPVQFGILSGPGTIAGNVLSPVGVGQVTIVALQPGNGDYEPATFVERTLTIEKAQQTINFNAPATVPLSSGSFRLAATSTSGLAVRYIVLSGPATLSGETLTFLGTGAISIRAFQPGDANHEPAIEVDRTILVIMPEPPTLVVKFQSGRMLLQWPTNQTTGFVLERSADLVTRSWAPVAESVSRTNSVFSVTVPSTEDRGFYRLKWSN